MNKRTVMTIKQVDYASYKDFENDVQKQKQNRYFLIENGMFNNCFNHGEVIGCDDWEYTAYYYKDKL